MAKVENTKDNQQLLKQIISANLKTLNIEKLETMLEVSKPITIPKSLRYKALMAVAKHYDKADTLHISFQYYYAARNFTKNIKLPLTHSLKCLNSFFWMNELEFSQNDLQVLLSAVQPLQTFLIQSNIKDESELALIDKLVNRINYRIKYTATDAIETKLTFRTNTIRDTLFGEMTFDEMQSEFAKFVTLMMINDESSESSEETDEEKEKPAEPTKRKKKKKGKDDED